MAKGRRAFQPSYHGGTLPDDADGSGTPSSMGVALPLGDPMNVNSSTLAATAKKRPLNSISLDSDSDPDDHGMLSSTLIGTGSLQLKVMKISLVLKKVFKMSTSSTVHSSSAISHNSSGAKQSPSYTSLSGQSSSFNFTKNVNTQTVKDMGNTIITMKDSLLITPKESSSKLHYEATAIVHNEGQVYLIQTMNACCYAHTTQHQLC